MKEQYIKQVEKELSLPRKMKKEVVRDLNEVFASAMEHGETEQQVIQRLGTPKEFADSTAEQFGIDNTKSKKRNGIISTLAALVIALGAGLGIWGVINLLEGYGNDNPGAKSQGMKQLMAGAGVAVVGMVLVPLLSGLFSV